MKTNIILDFVSAINNADVEKMGSLMAPDHIFIDSQDNVMKGRENMKQAWNGYFNIFPDYKIEINEIIEKDSLICMLGYASGTFKNLITVKNTNHWRIPAAWKAIVSEDHIKHWQVYADNSVVIEIVNRNKN
jgi:SnoaL-like domain